MTSARSCREAEDELRPTQVSSCPLDLSPSPTVFPHPMLCDPQPAKGSFPPQRGFSVSEGAEDVSWVNQ